MPEINAEVRKTLIWPFAAFLAANATKIIAFNTILTPERTASFLLQKLYTTLLMVSILYPIFFIIGSRALIIGSYLLQLLYITAGITYYLYFHTYLHITQAATLIPELLSTAGNSAVQLDMKAMVSILDLPFFIFLFLHMQRMPKPSKRQRLAALLVIFAALFMFFTAEGVKHMKGKSFTDLANDTYSGESPIIADYGTLAANLVSLWHTVNGSTWERQLKYGTEKSYSAIGQPAPNFVVIQVEAMDSEIVSKRYKGSYVTPFLHSLTEKSVYYPFTLSYHKGGGTSDSEFSILNSVEPLDNYPVMKLPDYSYPNSLLTRLGKSGYTAIAFHGNKGSFYNRDVAFPEMGFTEFFDMKKTQLPESGWGIPDADMFGFVYKRLQSINCPFLAYVITMSGHEPFESVSNYYNDSRFASIQNKTVKNYFNTMSYVDSSMKSFIGRIQSDFKNTYVIVTGDHTPNIVTKDYRQSSISMDNRYFEFVPLILITPDGKSYHETSRTASFLDVAPTILTASGISSSIRTDGMNLLAPEEKAGVIPYRGGSYDRGVLFKKLSKQLLQ